MDFNTWKDFYAWGFCTKEQLEEAVKQGMLSNEQYNSIVGVSNSVEDKQEKSIDLTDESKKNNETQKLQQPIIQ